MNNYIPDWHTKFTLLYALKTFPPMVTWINTHYPTLTADQLIGQVTMTHPDEARNLSAPAIRYRMLYREQVLWAKRLDRVRKLEIEWFIESLKNDLDESDQIRDIIRGLFVEDEGRYIGKFTETPTYQSAVVSASMSYIPMQTWDFTELSTMQMNSDDQGKIIGTLYTVAKGQFAFTMIKFMGNIARLNMV